MRSARCGCRCASAGFTFPGNGTTFDGIQQRFSDPLVDNRIRAQTGGWDAGLISLRRQGLPGRVLGSGSSRTVFSARPRAQRVAACGWRQHRPALAATGSLLHGCRRECGKPRRVASGSRIHRHSHTTHRHSHTTHRHSHTTHRRSHTTPPCRARLPAGCRPGDSIGPPSENHQVTARRDRTVGGKHTAPTPRSATPTTRRRPPVHLRTWARKAACPRSAAVVHGRVHLPVACTFAALAFEIGEPAPTCIVVPRVCAGCRSRFGSTPSGSPTWPSGHDRKRAGHEVRPRL
jgi:hypothetical protein